MTHRKWMIAVAALVLVMTLMFAVAPWACWAAEPLVFSGAEASIHTAGGPLEDPAVKEAGVWNLWMSVKT